MTWQVMQPASIQKYYSPQARYNIIAHDQSVLRARSIEDIFLIEDTSGYEGPYGVASERRDQAIEDYFSEKLQLAQDGNNKFMTYQKNRSDISPKYAQNSDLRPITQNDINNGAEVFAYYHLKMTGGLIFKTDQLKCQTPYKHPMTLHEAFGTSNTQQLNNHEDYINSQGEMLYTDIETYCYFLFLPKNKDLGPYVARVHQSDVDSLYYIYRGMAPYLRINSELHSKLDPGTGDLHFVKGRYILPGRDGKFLVPQNGLNLLFNRVSIYRPYHHDRSDIARGHELAWNIYQELGNMPPSKPAGDNWNSNATKTFEISGANLILTGLQIEDQVTAEFHQEVSEGTKMAFGSKEGVQYLALGPEDLENPTQPRHLPSALHFLSTPTEKGFLNKALDSDFDGTEINHNRAGELGALDKSELNEYLNLTSVGGDDRRLFQLYMKSNYNMDGDMIDIALGPGSKVIPCAEVDSKQVKEYCDTFNPALLNELKTFYSNIQKSLPPPFEDPANDPDDVNQMLSTLSNAENYAIQGAPFPIEKRLIDVVDALDTPLNQQLNELINSTEPNVDLNEFLYKTEEGQKIDAMRAKLQNGLVADDKLYSDLYFAGKEDEYFVNFIANLRSEMETKPESQRLTFLQTGIEPLKHRYNDLENDKYLQGSFLYYTGKENDGRRLLSRLYIFTGKETMNQASGFDNVEWGYYGTDSLHGTCALQNMILNGQPTVENCLNALVKPDIVMAPEEGTNSEGIVIPRY
ncbi:MAG: hypothetical protein VX619_00240 [bacterium]|nr:hypothetical protein [bacterium]